MEVIATLGDHISTQKGYAFKSAWYTESGHPIVKVSDFTSDSVDPSNLVCVPNEIALKHGRYSLSTGDVVIQTVGSWPSNPASVVGKTVRIPKKIDGALLNQNAVKVESDQSLDKGFLFYLLRSDEFREYIVGTAQGAASQASITLDSIRAFKFTKPDLESQQKIANTLAAYDNLIENNNRRIAILEEMAQSLYREWFVKFRFPGHRQAKFIDSPLGKIPEGWEIKKLKNIAAVNPESITKKNSPEVIQYIDIKSVSSGSIDEIKPMPFIDAPSRARRVVQDGDIIWATVRPNRKQYSYIAKPEQNTIVSTGFAVIRTLSVPSPFLLQALTTDDFVSYLVNHASGAAYPAVNASEFENADILVPDEVTMKQFNNLSELAIQQCETLKKKNSNLAKQRDLLLPKLISGQINIEG